MSNIDPYIFSTELNTPRSNSFPYKFEYGGMLVYDIKAKQASPFSSESITPSEISPKFNNSELKSLKMSRITDYNSALLLKEYPPKPAFPTEYLYQVPNDRTTLTFDSKFESGNLSKAIKMSDYDYKLYLNNDIGTSCYNHWFYFSVTNPRKTSVTFNIVNMRKTDVLYKSGMKIAVFSKFDEIETGKKWHRDGTKISYLENPQKDPSTSKSYTLSFTYSFKYENDLVYFAYSVPYTYEDLNAYLSEIKERNSHLLRIDTMCETLANNPCPVLTITEDVFDYIPHYCEKKFWSFPCNTRKKNIAKMVSVLKPEEYREEKHKKKIGIVLMSRVHSGETVSSFMMKGAIDFLISNNPLAILLRKNCVFKIIPMLNPDGVIYGNYRTSLLGVDLNRRWNKPNRLLHPTIYYAKKMIGSFKEIHDVKMVCDMHGHTKKWNVFMYGCCTVPQFYEDYQSNLLAKTIPYQMYLKNKFFSLKDSHFRLEADKDSTARVVLYKEFNLPHTYTMEASFFGYKTKKGNIHFCESDLETLGRDLCRVCINFTSKKKYFFIISQTNNYLRSNLISENYAKQEKMKIKEVLEEYDGEDSELEGKLESPGCISEKNLGLFESVEEAENNQKIEPNQKDANEDNSPNIGDIGETLERLEKTEDLLNLIDVVNILPDESSSGSESEVTDDEEETVKTQKKNQKLNLISSKIIPPEVPEKKTQPEISCKKSVRSKVHIAKKPIKNLESLNISNFNFHEKIEERQVTKEYKKVYRKIYKPVRFERKSFNADQNVVVNSKILFPVLCKFNPNNISNVYFKNNQKSISGGGVLIETQKFLKKSSRLRHFSL